MKRTMKYGDIYDAIYPIYFPAKIFGVISFTIIGKEHGNRHSKVRSVDLLVHLIKVTLILGFIVTTRNLYSEKEKGDIESNLELYQIFFLPVVCFLNMTIVQFREKNFLKLLNDLVNVENRLVQFGFRIDHRAMKKKSFGLIFYAIVSVVFFLMLDPGIVQYFNTRAALVYGLVIWTALLLKCYLYFFVNCLYEYYRLLNSYLIYLKEQNGCRVCDRMLQELVSIHGLLRYIGSLVNSVFGLHLLCSTGFVFSVVTLSAYFSVSSGKSFSLWPHFISLCWCLPNILNIINTSLRVVLVNQEVCI